MTENQKRIAGLKHLAKDLGGEVGDMVMDAIQAAEREAWLRGFLFAQEMDEAIQKIAKVIDPSG